MRHLSQRGTRNSDISTRRQAGEHAEAAHRNVSALHLANIALRVGRKLRWDPVAEQLVGDEQANGFVNIPIRAPWRLAQGKHPLRPAHLDLAEDCPCLAEFFG